MTKHDNPPGIRIRVAKDRMIQLVDRETGQWIANVRWRPCGVVCLELGDNVSKLLAPETRSKDTI